MKSSTVIPVLVAAAFLVWLLWSRFYAFRRATPIDPKSPQWQHAVARAQASLSIVRGLHEAEPGTVLVKFPVTSTLGTREHAWGELLSIDESTFTASVETEMVEAAPASAPPYKLPLTSLEDWLKFQPDGLVRGGFTVQAEIALARAEGKRPSKQARSMEGRFVDA